jgi:hypothetical protein
LESRVRVKTSVEVGGLSDHHPISLQIVFDAISPKPPLKINKNWLAEEDFKNLVLSEWRSLDSSITDPMMKKFSNNLARVKWAIKKWIPIYKARNQRDIQEIEEKISSLVSDLDYGSPPTSAIEELKSLEAWKIAWLEKEEVEWRQRSRAIWLEVGDNNTKFFHQYVNYRKCINTISEIKNDEGITVSSFQEKAEVGALFF